MSACFTWALEKGKATEVCETRSPMLDTAHKCHMLNDRTISRHIEVGSFAYGRKKLEKDPIRSANPAFLRTRR